MLRLSVERDWLTTVKIIAQLGLQLRIGEANGAGGRQIERPQLARIEQRHQLLALRLLVVRLDHASADNRPGDGFGAIFQLDLGALHLIQKERQRCLAVDLEWKIGQFLDPAARSNRSAGR